MLVEDDDDIREITKLVLSTIGHFNVVAYSSGEEALKKVLEDRPQLILLDVMMPNMTGPMILEKLQLMPDAASIPVVFLTAKVQKSELMSYRTLGVVDIITKPFDPMALSDVVLEIWNKQGIS